MNKLFLSLIIATAIGLSSCSNSTSKQYDAPDISEEPVAGNSLRVMAYNIHHANPPSKPDYIDIDAIVRVIRDQHPDVVALQEVDVNVKRSGDVDEAKEIATKLDMNVYFGKAIDYQGGDYGVAILSKFPLSDETVHRLPTKAETNGEPRILATAKITLPNGTEILFGSTHLDAQKNPVNRELQINKIVQITSNENLPIIIAGDFNAVPESEVIKVLDAHFKRTCSTCPPTIPVVNPSKAIDFIAFRHPEKKFSVASHKVINENYASDHLPVVAVINISE